MVVERKAEMDMVERWENRFMPFIRPAVIALISAAVNANRDPWAGDLEGLGGEGTVATARAWISPEGVLRQLMRTRLTRE